MNFNQRGTGAYPHHRKPTSWAICLLAAMLAACGGGGSGGSGDTAPAEGDGDQGNNGKAVATVASPTSGQTAWRVATSLSVKLIDQNGKALTSLQCTSADISKLTVAPDCSSATGLRLGAQEIVVSSGTTSAKASIKVVPQRTWAGTQGAASGGDYNLVSEPDGSVLAWGYNAMGVLGQNKGSSALTSLSLPANVLGADGLSPLGQVVQTSTGEDVAYALSENGNVWVWGANTSYRFGRDDLGNGSLLPVRVRNSANSGDLARVVQAAVGDSNGVALIDDGSVLTWSYYNGQGTGSVARFPAAPVRVADAKPLTDIVAISAGSSYTLALDSTGSVWSWGYAGAGATGESSPTKGVTASAQQIMRADGTPLTNVVSISAGYSFALALTSDGKVYGWGSNSGGQLGLAVADSDRHPYAVPLKDASGLAELSGIAMVVAGGRHALLLDTTGRVWSVGGNNTGELGRGPNVSSGTGNRSLPGPVVSEAGIGQLDDVVSVAAGYSHSLALKSDGTVLIWGTGFDGNLGQGTSSTAYQPTPVAVKRSAGVNLSLAPLNAYSNLKQRFR